MSATASRDFFHNGDGDDGQGDGIHGRGFGNSDVHGKVVLGICSSQAAADTLYVDMGKATLTRYNTITEIAYKDDPTIFTWELMNKPRCPLDLSGNKIQTPCGHNYCLKCFQKWAKESKTCVICRAVIPSKVSANPRINSALVTAIRMATCAKLASSGHGQVYHFMRNDARPEKAFTTDRAKRAGKANACSGQIFVTVAPDHFGPIPAENDPKTNRGVMVGDSWED